MLASACAHESGTLKSTVYGEEFIERGIPADNFEDGWSVEFDSFVVSIGDVSASASDGAQVADPGVFIVELAHDSEGNGFELASLAAPAGHYDRYAYRLIPSATPMNLNADARAATTMAAEGYSVWVRGTATKDSVVKTIDWGFSMKLAYAGCALGGTVDGDELVAQATIHADHLFYDDAISDEPNLAFQLIADADGAAGEPADGNISLAELEAVDIRGLPRYQVGSLRDAEGDSIDNLRQYIEHQVVTVGHINGEGHCKEQRQER